MACNCNRAASRSIFSQVSGISKRIPSWHFQLEKKTEIATTKEQCDELIMAKKIFLPPKFIRENELIETILLLKGKISEE